MIDGKNLDSKLLKLNLLFCSELLTLNSELNFVWGR
jgi:hypothetical protein